MNEYKLTTSDNISMELKHQKFINSLNDISRITKSTLLNRIRPIIENFLLIWLNPNPISKNHQDILIQLRNIINNIKIFADQNKCVDFFTEVKESKIFLIVDVITGEQIIPVIHNNPQLYGIFIISDNEIHNEKWIEKWIKIKKITRDVTFISEFLQSNIKQYNRNSISISFVHQIDQTNSNENLNELEPSFMYTQIFKEILLDMEYNEQSIQKFTQILRRYYTDNSPKLNTINEFEQNYCSDLSIWWYTKESFIYEFLNKALRKMESETIINMGFFIRDLHDQIKQLHRKQVENYHGQTFFVYRGQSLSKIDFDKLIHAKGGLISFNNFLSTSYDENISLFFAESSLTENNIGILFKISIDPLILSVPFARITELTNFLAEEEILFSMHTVFRIGNIQQITDQNRLYQVELQLTNNDDKQLRLLTNYFQEELLDFTGWTRLANLLLKIGDFTKAEELYQTLLEETSDEIEKAFYYHRLGEIKFYQEDSIKALFYFEQALHIHEKFLPLNHPFFATSYNNIGASYGQMKDYSEALSFYEKSLVIFENTLPSNHISLAAAYHNIGSLYNNMGDYTKALIFYEKDLKINKEMCPLNHPSIAISYNNIGLVYDKMENYTEAVKFYEQALEINKKTLPWNHHVLSISYHNIGIIFNEMGEYLKALSFFEKHLEITESSHPLNQLSLASIYNHIGKTYDNMDEYSKAISFHEKAINIRREMLPSNDPDLAASYNNIAIVYMHMKEYSKALLFYKQAFEIFEKVPSSDHLSLAAFYNNLGSAYNAVKDHSNALLFHEKSLSIYENVLPSDHRSLASLYNNIGGVYYAKDEYSKAVSFYEKSVAIFEKILPLNHPDLATSYNNIGYVYNQMEDYSDALLFYEKSLEIKNQTLPQNHSDFPILYANIGLIYDDIGEYSKALSHLEHALRICQETLSFDDPNFMNIQEYIEIIKKKV